MYKVLYVQNKTLLTLKNVYELYLYVCCEMNVFINHFPKIYRSAPHKITMDLLYSWDVYNVNLQEKNFGRSMAYIHVEQTFI